MDTLERPTYSVRVAAGMLGISRQHARQLAEQGELPAIKRGGRTLIKRAPLDRMLADDGEQRGGFRTVGRGA